MKLVLPDVKYKRSFLEAIAENLDQDEVGFGMLGEYYKELGSPETFEDYVQVRKDHSEGRNLPDGWIPATTYWLIDGDEFIGETNLRHELTDFLRKVGGHVGYWIRPSKRKKGFGTKILELVLKKAREMSMKRILVTCDEDNVGSKKIIEANGGVFEKANDMGKGKPKKLLFWISLLS